MPRTVSKIGDGEQADDQAHTSVLSAVMHQHLIDDDLEEQRRDQAEKLEEEGGDEHFAQQFRYLWIAPINQVMSKRRVISASPARRVIRNQFAVPERKQFSLRHQDGSRGMRGLDQDLVLTRLGNDHETAVAQRRDRRQGCFRQPRPVAAAGPAP